ncbi:nuclear transport factor 2 family protein [Pedobacter sp. Leaf176]|uniref:nuclear transport factor 2 family protein n=1 Tax=Pedobacter sp. Leaf176 TaxID=1736286 RepID=UPI0006F28D5A|nr:nuclear transport factor 2 family protein [Pedobacter sp. Leaf176]KQR65195.1 steroid delta-isomerase [Pedobacter sp. Leaf176]
MTPKEVLQLWIEAFNNADLETLMLLYHENAINHQVANEPVEGKFAIRKMFEAEFANAEMVCQPVNIFQDGEWAIMEWQDPKGFRGCGFFKIQEGKIILQRGYWDKLSFFRLYDIPL